MDSTTTYPLCLRLMTILWTMTISSGFVDVTLRKHQRYGEPGRLIQRAQDAIGLLDWIFLYRHKRLRTDECLGGRWAECRAASFL
jgi:hypothetical protein